MSTSAVCTRYPDCARAHDCHLRGGRFVVEIAGPTGQPGWLAAFDSYSIKGQLKEKIRLNHLNLRFLTLAGKRLN
jgi:hypothetical protein